MLRFENVVNDFRNFANLGESDQPVRDLRIRASASKSFRTQLTAYAKREINKSLRNMEQTTKSGEQKDALARYLMYAALFSIGSGFNNSENTPTIHHWVPRCYISRFERLNESKKGDLIFVEQRHSHGRITRRQLKDSHFVHGVDENGKGFYDNDLEMFFGYLENRYAFEMDKIEDGREHTPMTLTILAGFLVMQSIRAVNMVAQSLHDFVDEIVSVLDSLDSAHLSIGSVESPQGFLPYNPTRIVESKGIRSYVFPLSSNLSLLMSDSKIEDSDCVSERARVNVLKHLQRTGGVMYGVV